MKILSWVFVCMSLGLACAWASDEEKSTVSDQLTLSLEDPAQEQAAYDKHWYFGVGGTNYHPRLRESEGQIQRELNGLFDWMPRWKKPTTFADWRDDFMLWDFVAGFGRDLTPKTNWMLWFGGAAGSMTSRERYGLISTKINFKRSSLFLAPELFYYPLGKVDYGSIDGTHGLQRVRAALANAKPYLSLVTGFTFVKAEADVKFKAPALGTLFRQEQSENHYMYTVSPRVGLTMPIGKNTSLNPVFIYLFNGPNHSTEYNGWALSFTVRWQF
ncbi:MAG TPA: hypothetical protein PKO23_01035 [Candidatus Hydrogenedentes bacterium]|jgi:hypothetical protein|nr:hypothetical protein [Candidatus Hydrogenedentota bacterium]